MMNRRSFLKKAFGGMLTLIGLGGGSYVYAREVEPNMLHNNHQKIVSANIPPAFKNFKIIQFSDTHVGFHYTIDQLEQLVLTINNEAPDVIVFTGDLIDEPQSYMLTDQLIETLQTLQAPHGKYWIYGNHDHGGYGTQIVKDIMDQAGFTLLKNSHIFIQQQNEHIVLAGIDDVMLGNPNVAKALEGVDPNLFTILLAHEPDFADVAATYPVNLQLSGHSHGGQVRLPFIGHLYTPAFAEKYIQGKYMLQNDHMALYVSRGIGTTRLPFRFLCKPEFYTFTLTNTASDGLS